MRSPLVHVDLGARSHPGKVRLNNEDHYLVTRFERTMKTLLTNVPEGTVPTIPEPEEWALAIVALLVIAYACKRASIAGRLGIARFL